MEQLAVQVLGMALMAGVSWGTIKAGLKGLHQKLDDLKCDMQREVDATNATLGREIGTVRANADRAHGRLDAHLTVHRNGHADSR